MYIMNNSVQVFYTYFPFRKSTRPPIKMRNFALYNNFSNRNTVNVIRTIK